MYVFLRVKQGVRKFPLYLSEVAYFSVEITANVEQYAEGWRGSGVRGTDHAYHFQPNGPTFPGHVHMDNSLTPYRKATE